MDNNVVSVQATLDVMDNNGCNDSCCIKNNVVIPSTLGIMDWKKVFAGDEGYMEDCLYVYVDLGTIEIVRDI